ncbi:unnamed protein product, partial [Ascophyllum nodosum]
GLLERTFVKKQKPGQGPLAGVPLLGHIRSHIDLDQCLSLVSPIYKSIRGSRGGSPKYIHQGHQHPAAEQPGKRRGPEDD